MEPTEVLIWRNALGFTQSQVAAACGRERSWYYRMENGETPIPRWFVYLTAWTRLYGIKVPFSAADMPAKIRELRNRWGFTQDDLGYLLDLSRDTIIAAEKGRPRPMGIAFAIAWIEFYGSRLPFTTLLVPIPRCPHCGNSIPRRGPPLYPKRSSHSLTLGQTHGVASALSLRAARKTSRAAFGFGKLINRP